MQLDIYGIYYILYTYTYTISIYLMYFTKHGVGRTLQRSRNDICKMDKMDLEALLGFYALRFMTEE